VIINIHTISEFEGLNFFEKIEAFRYEEAKLQYSESWKVDLRFYNLW